MATPTSSPARGSQAEEPSSARRGLAGLVGADVEPTPPAGTTLGTASGPAQPVGNGPTGAAAGPLRAGGVAPISFSHAASKPAVSVVNAVVNASSSLTPFAYERMRPMRASLP
jgi:hypothetical protein